VGTKFTFVTKRDLYNPSWEQKVGSSAIAMANVENFLFSLSIFSHQDGRSDILTLFYMFRIFWPCEWTIRSFREKIL